MTHTVMAIVSRVKPAELEDLRCLLNKIGDDPENNSYVPFRSLKALHFSSLVLHDAHQKEGFAPCLVFENNFDGALDPFLQDLCRLAGPGLHQIYTHCEDYELASADKPESLVGYLRAHVIRPTAYHIGNTGRLAERILEERDLKDALEAFSDQVVASPGYPPSVQDLRSRIQDHIRSVPQFKNLAHVGPRQTFLDKFLSWIKIDLMALILLLIVFIRLPRSAIAVGVVLAAYFLALRWKESRDSVSSELADPDNVKSLVDKEDHTHSVQNHMASITIVKPGWLRRATLWAVLSLVNMLARASATHGVLSGIPSIHFAHWSLIDGGRRLLFLSNFDGSWENYLGDFIDKAHAGLTAVWSNTVDFPRTRFLIFGGATDGPRFKAMARNSQTVTNAWYSAYRDLTVQGIDNNSSLREQLFPDLSNDQTAQWLMRL